MFKRFISIIKARKILVFIGVIILVGVLFFFKKQTNSIEVETYTVSKQEIVKTITASGKTSPKDEYVARSGVAAKVNELFFESGVLVNEGDIILTFDQASIRAETNSAWKSYLDAKAAKDSLDDQIKAAETDLSEKKQIRDSAWRDYMGDNGESTKQAYKTAESNYQDSLAALTVLKDKETAVSQGTIATYSIYSAASQSLKDGTVRSPTTGTLVLEDISKGTSVLVGQKLFSITNYEGTEFTAEIDETDIQYIKEGQKAEVILEGYTDDTQYFVGTVSRIDGKTQLTTSGSTIIPASIKFISGPPVTLILDMSGTATIEVGRESNSPAIPFETIYFDSDDKTYVFVVKDGTVEKREVTLGFEGADYIGVSSGLVEGEVIVIGDTISRLTDGSKISVIKN